MTAAKNCLPRLRRNPGRNHGKTRQLFTFTCDLSHKGQELLTLCTEWAARCDSVAGKVPGRYGGGPPWFGWGALGGGESGDPAGTLRAAGAPAPSAPRHGTPETGPQAWRPPD